MSLFTQSKRETGGRNPEGPSEMQEVTRNWNQEELINQELKQGEF